MKIIGIKELEKINLENVSKENIVQLAIEVEKVVKQIRIENTNLNEIYNKLSEIEDNNITIEKEEIDDYINEDENFYIKCDFILIDELPEIDGFEDFEGTRYSGDLEIFRDNKNNIRVDTIYFIDETGDSFESIVSLFNEELAEYKDNEEILEIGKKILKEYKKNVITIFSYLTNAN